METQNGTRVIFDYPGELDGTKGWIFQPEGEKEYIPFETAHEERGGRIESRRIAIDNISGSLSFYRLTFSAKAAVQGYWWVDFYDKGNELLPDVNSALYASADELHYSEVIPVPSDAVSLVVAFVTRQGATARNIRLEQLSIEEAAAWCDALYATLPQKPFSLPADAFALLPKTKAALNGSMPWRILMLGDSLVNDTWCSNFQALVMRDFPNAKLDFQLSVRGSTGCWYYKNPEPFQQYVARLHPDLVMIGGVSNAKDPEVNGNPEENLISLIEQCQALGAEVLLMSPPPSRKWRKGVEPASWSEEWSPEKGILPYQRDYQRAAVAKRHIAYWDMTTIPCDILADCQQPSEWFSRDAVHNNDRGKQLIGQLLAAWFRTAVV